MRQIGGGCDDGNCPKIHEEDNGDFRIQGATLIAQGVPEHESVVRVPRDVMLQAVAALQADA